MDKRMIVCLLVLIASLVVARLYGPLPNKKSPNLVSIGVVSEEEIAAITLSQAEEELAKTIGFDRKVVQLAKLNGEGLKRFEGYDEAGDPKAVDGLSLDVSQEDVLGTLDVLRAQLEPLGCLAYRYEVNFGIDDSPDRLAIIKSGDKFDIVRFMQTDGANYDIDNAKLIAKLKDWDSRFGIELLGAGTDFVEARFVNPPNDMLAFAREVNEFCPDVVDQGTGSVKELAKEMKRRSRLFLWWD